MIKFWQWICLTINKFCNRSPCVICCFSFLLLSFAAVITRGERTAGVMEYWSVGAEEKVRSKKYLAQRDLFETIRPYGSYDMDKVISKRLRLRKVESEHA